jgi:hypothetical protein
MRKTFVTHELAGDRRSTPMYRADTPPSYVRGAARSTIRSRSTDAPEGPT